MRIGTSHFINKESAVKYYEDYGYENPERAVIDKLNKKEIHLGKPKIQETEYLIINDEGRYIRIDK